MQEVEFFCIWWNKVIDETEMFGKNACVVVLCNFMGGDNKLLSEFVIICHRWNHAIVKHVS